MQKTSLKNTYLPLLLAFLIPLITYIWGLADSVVIEGDSGEIITGIKEFGVIHSPGFPGYIVLAKLFTTLLAWIPVDRASNLFSAFCGALASFWVCRIAVRLGFAWLGLAAGLLLAFSDEFWYASIATEVYSLAILALIILTEQAIFLDWQQKWNRIGAGFWTGLSIAIHVYSWAYLPLLLALTWKQILNSKEKAFGLFSYVVGLSFGLTPYLYIPWRANMKNFVNEGGINNFERFWSHVTWILQRERVVETAKMSFSEWISAKGTQAVYFAKEIIHQWGPVGVLLTTTAILLSLYELRNSRESADKISLPLKRLRFLAVTSSIYMPLIVWFVFTGHDIDEGLLAEMSVHLLTFYTFCVLTTLYILARKFEPRDDRKLALSLLLLPLSVFLWRFSNMNLSNNQIALNHAADLLNELPNGTILLGDSDNDLMPTIFTQAVKLQRQDVIILNLMNGTDWNYDNYRARLTKVQWPAYSKTYYASLVPINFERFPIYFTSWFGANAYLDVSKQRDKYDIVPIHGAYRLVSKNEDWVDRVIATIDSQPQRTLNTNIAFHLRDREKDVMAGHSEFQLRMAEYLLQKGRPEAAGKAARIGTALKTLGDTDYGKQVRDALFKLLIHLQK